MKRSVKPRTYSSDLRTSAAARTRRAILAAAVETFVERGYVRTTMAEIAARAEVAVDTVYATVGRKPDLFRELIEAAISGADRAVPALERDYVARVRAARTADEKLRLYADALLAIQTRLTPLFLVLRDAGAAEPALQALWNEISARRARNMRQFADDLLATGSVRASLDRDAVADILWSMNGSEYYTLLVGERGWRPTRFARWLAEAWSLLLLS